MFAAHVFMTASVHLSMNLHAQLPIMPRHSRIVPIISYTPHVTNIPNHVVTLMPNAMIFAKFITCADLLGLSILLDLLTATPIVKGLTPILILFEIEQSIAAHSC